MQGAGWRVLCVHRSVRVLPLDRDTPLLPAAVRPAHDVGLRRQGTSSLPPRSLLASRQTLIGVPACVQFLVCFAVAGIAVSRTFITLFIDSAEPYELLSDGMIAAGWVRLINTSSLLDRLSFVLTLG